MNLIFLISVIASFVFTNFVRQINSKCIPLNSELNAIKFSGLVSLSKQNISLENERIVGGDPVSIDAFPWIVSLLLDGSHFCGGSIISATRIVSAAHCRLPYTTAIFTIRAGSDIVEKGGQVVAVSKIVVHPHYDSIRFNNDISIVILASMLKMSTKVSVIGLPKQDEQIDDGSMVEVAGWGVMKEFECVTPQALQRVSVPIIGNEQCNIMYKGIITKSMLCAGYTEGRKDSCKGDSGGPLSWNGRTLIGVVSWGEGCARPNRPGVYTRVASFTDWIQSHL